MKILKQTLIVTAVGALGLFLLSLWYYVPPEKESIRVGGMGKDTVFEIQNGAPVYLTPAMMSSGRIASFPFADFPKLPKVYEIRPFAISRIVMDAEGRQVFTVERSERPCASPEFCMNPQGTSSVYVLVDHSTGHRYPFSYGADKGKRDKILFTIPSDSTYTCIRNGDYAYVQSE